MITKQILTSVSFQIGSTHFPQQHFCTYVHNIYPYLQKCQKAFPHEDVVNRFYVTQSANRLYGVDEKHAHRWKNYTLLGETNSDPIILCSCVDMPSTCLIIVNITCKEIFSKTCAACFAKFCRECYTGAMQGKYIFAHSQEFPLQSTCTGDVVLQSTVGYDGVEHKIWNEL